MRKLHFDFETQSSSNLKKAGTDVFAHDASTTVLMMAYAFDDDPVEIWEPHLGSMPEHIRQALTDPAVTKCSWNTSFEYNVCKYVLDVPVVIEQWYDPIAHARYLGYPGSLDESGDVLGLDTMFLKDKEGTKLRKLFQAPTKGTKKKPSYCPNWETHPEEWNGFKKYCMQDVVAERAIEKLLGGKAKWPDIERKTWFLDQEINRRGIPIDLDFVAKALKIVEDERAIILEKMIALTGVKNPNSVQQLKGWLVTQNYQYESTDKTCVQMALDGTQVTSLCREVLELKQLLGGIAFKKLPVIQARTRDNRLYEAFTYHAAHTGRWASRGVQFHNLKKPTKRVAEKNDEIVNWILTGENKPDLPVVEMVGGVLRAAVTARPGNRLMVADYSSIENRVLAWLAQCPGMLNVFFQGLDPYKSFAKDFYGIPYEQVTKDQRNFCKSPVLGCGFGMGSGRLVAYAAQMGQKISEEDAAVLVKAWRKMFPEVVEYWDTLGDTVNLAVARNKHFKLGCLLIDGRDSNMLHITLPSGRALNYDKPVIGSNVYGQPVLVYYGEGGAGGGWSTIEARGAALVENVVQAIARDLLVNGMFNLEEKGFPTVLHVHDELVAEVSYDSPLKYPEFVTCMTTNPIWALGLPIAAEGYEALRYKKG